MRARGGGLVRGGGGHRPAQVSQGAPGVLGADQDAVLAAGDVLVAGHVVDHAATLVADVERHRGLPMGPPGGHGIGIGCSRSTRLRREVATMCSTIPIMSISAPTAAMAQPSSPEGMPSMGRPNGSDGGAVLPLFCTSLAICLRKFTSAAANTAKPATNSSKPSQTSQRALVLVRATSRRKLSRWWITCWTCALYWSRPTLLITCPCCCPISYRTGSGLRTSVGFGSGRSLAGPAIPSGGDTACAWGRGAAASRAGGAICIGGSTARACGAAA